MPRKKSNPNPNSPVHITARCPNREQFPIPLGVVWEIMEDFLYMIYRQYGVQIHSFVLMPNHYHLIASSTEIPFGTVMKDFMFHTSLAMNQQAGKINQRWGTRHYRCELQSYCHYMNAYKYVYQNPVRAGLSQRCEEWKYSTLNGLLGFSRLIIPIVEDPILFGGSLDDRTLEWLNKPIQPENLVTMKECLSHTIFKAPPTRTTRKMNAIDVHLI